MVPAAEQTDIQMMQRGRHGREEIREGETRRFRREIRKQAIRAECTDQIQREECARLFAPLFPETRDVDQGQPVGRDAIDQQITEFEKGRYQRSEEL